MTRVGRIIVSVSCLAALLVACGRENASDPAAPPAPPATGGNDYDINALIATADVQRGQTLFLQCRACHSLAEGEAHKVGPNLYGMFGRQAGEAAGFAYSDVVIGSGVVWTPESLDEWLARPSEFLPGNRMVFVGIKKPEDRAHLIAYVQRETGATTQ